MDFGFKKDGRKTIRFQMLVKLADVLEVQTSQLLEVKADSDVQTTEEKQNA